MSLYSSANIQEILGRYTQPRDRSRPETPLAVLEQALVMARDENKWAKDWIELDTETPEGSAYSFNDSDPSGLSCNNVKACAMGLLVLATFDGPFVRAYYDNQGGPLGTFDSLCETNPLIRVAGPILAYAMDVVNGDMRSFDQNLLGYENEDFEAVPLGEYLEHPAKARSKVIYINDTLASHGFIVRSFEKAVEVASQAPYNQPVPS